MKFSANSPFSEILTGKRVLITGGTGSLGKVLVKRLLSGEVGMPAKITIFSRDEGKQHAMRMEYMRTRVAAFDIIYDNFRRLIDFRIGDVRDPASLAPALANADIVVNAAALKQVPTCEYFPYQAVATNVLSAENIVRLIRDHKLPVETVVCISTDKAAKPVNVMGMTKAIQERILLNGNIDCRDTRFIAVRYGNVLASRGSVIPLFLEQIRNGGPVTITNAKMTRFLLSLNNAVDIIFRAIHSALPGELYVPVIPSATVGDIAKAMIGERDIKIEDIGPRPGEKLHEILISEEEVSRSFRRGDYYVIASHLPELQYHDQQNLPRLKAEYSSADNLMTLDQVRALLAEHRLRPEDGYNGPDRRTRSEEDVLR